jgi:hypothetical protein
LRLGRQLATKEEQVAASERLDLLQEGRHSTKKGSAQQEEAATGQQRAATVGKRTRPGLGGWARVLEAAAGKDSRINKVTTGYWVVRPC